METGGKPYACSVYGTVPVVSRNSLMVLVGDHICVDLLKIFSACVACCQEMA
jgi:hypothetical protein